MAVTGKKLSELEKIQDSSIRESLHLKYVPVLDTTRSLDSAKNVTVNLDNLLSVIIDDENLSYNRSWSSYKVRDLLEVKADRSYVQSIYDSLINELNSKATKSYVDNLLLGISWQNPVINFVTQAQLNSLSPQENDRYIITDGTNINKIAIRQGGSWVYVTPQNNWAVVRSSNNSIYVYNSNSTDAIKWMSLQGVAPPPYNPYKYFTLTTNMSAGDLVVLNTNGTISKITYNPITFISNLAPSNVNDSVFMLSVIGLQNDVFVYTYQRNVSSSDRRIITNVVQISGGSITIGSNPLISYFNDTLPDAKLSKYDSSTGALFIKYFMGSPATIDTIRVSLTLFTTSGTSIITQQSISLSLTSGYLNVARNSLAGAGTSNSALSFGGYNPNFGIYLSTTELFDKVVWTTKNNMNVARYGLAGAGTSNSALSFGGDSSTGYVATTELFDGISWTTKNNMNVDRERLAGAGTSNSALSFGGYRAGAVATTELFDGTSWTIKNNMNVARSGLAGAGTSNSALSFGGIGGTRTTELFDGTSWTTKNGMYVDRYDLAGAGTSNSALSFGGHGSEKYLAATELFNGTNWHDLYNYTLKPQFFDRFNTVKLFPLSSNKVLLSVGKAFASYNLSPFSFDNYYLYIDNNTYAYVIDALNSTTFVTYRTSSNNHYVSIIQYLNNDLVFDPSLFMFETGVTLSNVRIKRLTDISFLLVYSKSGVYHFRIGVISSGPNISFTSPIILSGVSNVYDVCVLSESTFIVYHPSGIVPGNIDSQNQIEFGSNIPYNSSYISSSYNAGTTISPTLSAFVYSSGSIAKGYGIVYSQQTMGKVVGILQESGSAGQSKPVALFGDISKVHSGLVPGSTYYYNINTGNGLTTTKNDYPAGMAISQTELKIMYQKQ